jgi:hypothetical protein
VDLSRISIGPAVLFSFFLLSSLLIPLVFGSSKNWVEVLRLSGHGGMTGDSPPFTIEHAEWRIKWEYTSLFGWDWLNDFSFYVSHHEGETTIASISSPDKKNGTLDIFYYTGEFHLSFPPGSTNWTVIVEQNIDSPIQTENWTEVTTLTGQGGISSTDSFTVEHDDWRIIWEVEPSNETTWTIIQAYIFPVNGINDSEQWINKIERIDKSGILRIYNRSGSFYMDVSTGNVENYTMRIEQNIHSIPEFPSLTPFLIAGLSVVTVMSMFFRRNFKQERKI